jgi:hypothetical protein
MTPAFTISSLNSPIAVSISVLGITPASLFLSAFTITMNRIVTLRFSIQEAGCEPALIHKTNRVLRHRHVRWNYFEGNCMSEGAAHLAVWPVRLQEGPSEAAGENAA